MPLNLLNIAFAKQLSILDKFVTNLSSLAPVNEGILVLSELGLDGADLQIHLALVARLVHLLCQDLLHREAPIWIVV